MWALVVMFTMVAAVGAAMVASETRSPAVVQAADDNLARNMALYRSMVVEYVRTHPATLGPVADSALSFPPWYTRHPAWRNEVQAGGNIVVYAAQPVTPTLVVELVQVSHGSMLAGEARKRVTGETYLHSPRHGDTGIALPPMNPGSAVWLARLD